MYYNSNSHNEIVFLENCWLNDGVVHRGKGGKSQRYKYGKEFGWLQPAMAG